MNYQVGNFVKSGTKIYVIALISLDGVEAIIKESEDIVYPASSLIIEPIKIIDEWLLKFGFEQVYKSNRSTRFDVEINGHYMITYEFCANGTQNLIYGGKNIQCNFVHELQNFISIFKTYKN